MPPKKKKLSETNDIFNFYEHHATKEFIINYDNPNFENNQMKTPFMASIVSATGGGKTNFLCNLLKKFPNTFSHIYVCNSGASEPLYDMLRKTLKNDITIVGNLSKLPDLQSLEESTDQQKLFIFDDLVKTKNQGYVEQLYLRGRKLSCSCIYISQSFFDIDPFLRKQLHYLFILKLGGDKDARTILRNYALGVDKEQLLSIYKDATRQHLDVLKIDLRTADDNKKFSRNFTDFYQISDENY